MSWSNVYSCGLSVDTSKRTESSILFSNGLDITVRQWECVSTQEVRALAESAATGKVPNCASAVTGSDSTVQTVYYRHIDGRTVSITVTTGSKTQYSAARRDESGQWVCTETTTDYFAT